MTGLIGWKIIVLGFVLLFGLPAVVSAQKLMVGYSGVTAIQSPFWVIKDAGYFKQGDAGRQSHLHLRLVDYGASDAGR